MEQHTMDRTPITIHLGLPKTATTAIRFNLFAKHSQIHYLGKFIGGEFPAAIRPVILERWTIRAGIFAPDDIRKEGLDEQLAYAAGTRLKPVFSMESLAGGPIWKKWLQAQRFKKYFGDCRVILFVREPSSFLKSFYVQMLRNFQEREPGRWFGWMKTLGNSPRYFDINEWMHAAWHSFGSPRNYIYYANTARVYANVFGWENIKIFIFEEFVQDPEAFIAKLCDHIGVDPKEGFDLVHGKRSNERLTTDYIRRLQEVEKSKSLTEQFRNAAPNERRKLLEPKEYTGEKIDPQLSENWLKKINAIGDKQNRRLVKEWGLPLADYGYRV
jgi:hypothetical protein